MNWCPKGLWTLVSVMLGHEKSLGFVEWPLDTHKSVSAISYSSGNGNKPKCSLLMETKISYQYTIKCTKSEWPKGAASSTLKFNKTLYYKEQRSKLSQNHIFELHEAHQWFLDNWAWEKPTYKQEWLIMADLLNCFSDTLCPQKQTSIIGLHCKYLCYLVFFPSHSDERST